MHLLHTTFLYSNPFLTPCNFLVNNWHWLACTKIVIYVCTYYALCFIPGFSLWAPGFLQVTRFPSLLFSSSVLGWAFLFCSLPLEESLFAWRIVKARRMPCIQRSLLPTLLSNNTTNNVIVILHVWFICACMCVNVILSRRFSELCWVKRQAVYVWFLTSLHDLYLENSFVYRVLVENLWK